MSNDGFDALSKRIDALKQQTISRPREMAQKKANETESPVRLSFDNGLPEEMFYPEAKS